MSYDFPKCPHCGQPMIDGTDVGDIDDALLTRWGDESPVEVGCMECGKASRVVEVVTRWWELAP